MFVGLLAPKSYLVEHTTEQSTSIGSEIVTDMKLVANVIVTFL